MNRSNKCIQLRSNLERQATQLGFGLGLSFHFHAYTCPNISTGNVACDTIFVDHSSGHQIAQGQLTGPPLIKKLNPMRNAVGER